MSTCIQLVAKEFQPPSDGGPFLVTRRLTMVVQSVAWTSTLKPARSSCALATIGSCLMTCRSVGCGMTMTVPS